MRVVLAKMFAAVRDAQLLPESVPRPILVGAASKAADLGGERPLPSIARFGRLAYPIRGEVTNRALLGCKRHGRPGSILDVSGGNDLGGSKLGGLKIIE